MDWDRRTVLKTTGAAAGASLLPTGAGAAAAGPLSFLDDSFDLDGGLQEALVVFRNGVEPSGLLDEFGLDLTVEMEAVGITYTEALPETLKKIAAREDVQFVERNRRLEWDNGDAAETVNIEDRSGDRDGDGGGVQDTFDMGFTGDGVHVAVIDSGVDAYHPDLQDRIAHNYRFVEPTNEDTMWVDLGSNADSDDIGHGTHCSGSVAGEGNRNAQHAGMAPDAKLTVYSTGAAVTILQAVGAYNHILGTLHPEERVHITSNSYGGSGGNDFNPAGAQETATYRAYSGDAANRTDPLPGILVVSSAGNSGPGTNTLGAAKTAPHILCIAASHDGQGTGVDATTRPTSFSSRGRTGAYDQGEGARWDENVRNGRFTAEDRDTALRNVEAFHGTGFSDQPEVGSQSLSFTAGPGLDASVAVEGLSAGSPTFVEYTPSNASVGFAEVSVSWNPPGQDLDVNLREGSEDGPVVASGASLSNPETLSAQVDSGTTYFFEIIPFAAVQATGTIDIVEREPPANPPTGPYGVYRPSVIAPGSAVVSTMGASALKALEASYGATPADTGVLYSALSGTSMSCPITAGVCAVVTEAYFREYGKYPEPEEMFKLIEGGADSNAEDAYTPYNVGAGLVDAKRSVKFVQDGFVPDYSQIRLASLGDEPELLDVVGTRTDDGQVFTAGQTNEVAVTLTDLSHDVEEFYDVVPEGWDLLDGNVVEGVDDQEDRVFYYDGNGDGDPDTIAADEVGDGDTVTINYFVEVPAGSGPHSFGPARVVTSETNDGGSAEDDAATVPVGGTGSTEYVIGVDRSQSPL